MRMRFVATVAAVALVSFAGASFAGMEEAKKWVDSEFQPSTLSKAEQMKEMQWFVDAAAPFKGMEINVLSETIPTHEYESKTLTKAFEEITGIKVLQSLPHRPAGTQESFIRPQPLQGLGQSLVPGVHLL